MNDSTQSETTQAAIGSADRQITSSLKLSLRGDPNDLANHLYAINWFDTRPAWVYHLYNMLAASRLARVGGKPFFKGLVTRQLSGDDSLARQHLLIVNYPSADAFLNLVSDKVFKLFSVLRMISVRRFSFVMHRRSDDQNADRQPMAAHAVLHFASAAPQSIVQAVEELAKANGVRVEFAGKEAVHVFVDTKGDERAMEFVTPNTLVLASKVWCL